MQWWLTNGCIACAQVSVSLPAVFSNSEKHSCMHWLLPTAALHREKWYLKVIRALKNIPGMKIFLEIHSHLQPITCKPCQLSCLFLFLSV